MGHLEPSYVIQRFLSVQRLANLTTYLEKLHAAVWSSGAVEGEDTWGGGQTTSPSAGS